MGKQSSKGFASKGNNVPHVKNHQQAKSSDAISNGIGENSGTKLEASGNDGTESQKITFSGLVAIVKEHNEHNRSDLISRAWFPDAKEGAQISSNCADVPVLDGEAGYTLSTGERIKL